MIWTMIAEAVDDDVATLISAKRLTWMPAHKSLAAAGHMLKSNNRPVTAIEWRANRLADVLAKSAAGEEIGCFAASRLLGTAEALVKHEAALAGAVTYAANHQLVSVLSPEGRLVNKTLRDSTGVKRARVRRQQSVTTLSVAAAPSATTSAMAASPADAAGCLVDELRTLRGPPVRHERQRYLAAARRSASAARKAIQVGQLAALCASRAAMLRPSSAPPAAELIASVRARVRMREAARQGAERARGAVVI
jgi:hypothetical protein